MYITYDVHHMIGVQYGPYIMKNYVWHAREHIHYLYYSTTRWKSQPIAIYKHRVHYKLFYDQFVLSVCLTLQMSVLPLPAAIPEDFCWNMIEITPLFTQYPNFTTQSQLYDDFVLSVCLTLLLSISSLVADFAEDSSENMLLFLSLAAAVPEDSCENMPTLVVRGLASSFSWRSARRMRYSIWTLAWRGIVAFCLNSRRTRSTAPGLCRATRRNCRYRERIWSCTLLCRDIHTKLVISPSTAESEEIFP